MITNVFISIVISHLDLVYFFVILKSTTKFILLLTLSFANEALSKTRPNKMTSSSSSSTSLRQIPITCNGHTRPVVDLRYSEITPYSYFIISACKDGKPMLREGDTGDWLGTYDGHKGAVWGCSINREATRAATGAADFTAYASYSSVSVSTMSFTS